MLFGVQWYLWVLLVVVSILAVFAWIKAMAASRIRREKLRKEAEIWKKDYELRQEFKTLTLEKLNSTDTNKMLSGVCMNIQIELENANDMNEAFLNLPEEKKFIYCLEYFDEDCVKSLSTFFKNNGKRRKGNRSANTPPSVEDNPILPQRIFSLEAKKASASNPPS